VTDTQVPALDRAMYQRAARAVLTHPLITETTPTPKRCPWSDRWAVPLRSDLARLFDYGWNSPPARRGCSGCTTPSMRASRRWPVRTRTARSTAAGTACLALAVAVLGRSGMQVSLSEWRRG